MKDIKSFMIRRDDKNVIDYEMAGMLNSRISEYVKQGWKEIMHSYFTDCFGIMTESIILGIE